MTQYIICTCNKINNNNIDDYEGETHIPRITNDIQNRQQIFNEYV